MFPLKFGSTFVQKFKLIFFNNKTNQKQEFSIAATFVFQLEQSKQIF